MPRKWSNTKVGTQQLAWHWPRLSIYLGQNCQQRLTQALHGHITWQSFVTPICPRTNWKCQRPHLGPSFCQAWALPLSYYGGVSFASTHVPSSQRLNMAKMTSRKHCEMQAILPGLREVLWHGMIYWRLNRFQGAPSTTSSHECLKLCTLWANWWPQTLHL